VTAAEIACWDLAWLKEGARLKTEEIKAKFLIFLLPLDRLSWCLKTPVVYWTRSRKRPVKYLLSVHMLNFSIALYHNAFGTISWSKVVAFGTSFRATGGSLIAVESS
jgi:hypothetical protein